jgi:hypothetical protein
MGNSTSSIFTIDGIQIQQFSSFVPAGGRNFSPFITKDKTECVYAQFAVRAGTTAPYYLYQLLDEASGAVKLITSGIASNVVSTPSTNTVVQTPNICLNSPGIYLFTNDLLVDNEIDTSDPTLIVFELLQGKTSVLEKCNKIH